MHNGLTYFSIGCIVITALWMATERRWAWMTAALLAAVIFTLILTNPEGWGL